MPRGKKDLKFQVVVSKTKEELWKRLQLRTSKEDVIVEKSAVVEGGGGDVELEKADA